MKGVSQCVQCAIFDKLRICEECELYAKLPRFQVKFVIIMRNSQVCDYYAES